jgi:hypothetical protein
MAVELTKKKMESLSIAQIVEREWAEIEIRKGRIKIERLIKRKLS